MKLIYVDQQESSGIYFMLQVEMKVKSFFGNILITTVLLLLFLLQTYASAGENIPLFCAVWVLKLQFLWWGTSFPLWHH